MDPFTSKLALTGLTIGAIVVLFGGAHLIFQSVQLTKKRLLLENQINALRVKIQERFSTLLRPDSNKLGYMFRCQIIQEVWRENFDDWKTIKIDDKRIVEVPRFLWDVLRWTGLHEVLPATDVLSHLEHNKKFSLTSWDVDQMLKTYSIREVEFNQETWKRFTEIGNWFGTLRGLQRDLKRLSQD